MTHREREETSFPGTTNVVHMPGRENPFFDDDDDDDDDILEAVRRVAAVPADVGTVAATESAYSFFDSSVWNILRDWGVPAVISIAGTFLGVPAPISAGLGGVAKAALGGVSRPAEVKNTFAQQLVKTSGKAAPEILKALLDGTVKLLDEGGKAVTAIAKGIVGGEQELREIIRWFQENKMYALSQRAESLRLIEQITDAAEGSVERSSKRRKLAETAVDNASLIMDALRFWEKFVERITEIWNKAYSEFRDGKKKQTNSLLA